MKIKDQLIFDLKIYLATGVSLALIVLLSYGAYLILPGFWPILAVIIAVGVTLIAGRLVK
ncbi:hypothetical protein [Mixta intestinalis]|uniref:Uncharacterized protein n=1 Tax=Mixta intestinalis TaxID=1615494 RepID=A0A6P1Q124_9GAMM|nr:hypothetical protein [Mixta intestinalis]QHM72111.1 hypothetical protein C7M51_02411 [Mixta intestinalis]